MQVYPRQEVDPAYYSPIAWGRGPELEARDRFERRIRFRGSNADAPRFLAPRITNVTPETSDYWVSLGLCLPAPLHRQILAFDYATTEDPEDTLAVVQQTFAELGVEYPYNVTMDQFKTLKERVFALLNRHCAIVLSDVYMLCEPSFINLDSSHRGKKTLKWMTREKFKQAFSHLKTTLRFDNEPKHIKWIELWLEDPLARRYQVARSFSRPHAAHTVRVFNKWTGNILPHEAFTAARANSRLAVDTVNFFQDFLQNVVANDPYETPEYNQWAFEVILHLFIWTVKYPHDKFPFAVFLWSNEQGIGKGRCTEILSALAGIANVYNSVGMRGMTGDFLGYIVDKQLIIIDEEANDKALKEAYPVLKHLVTDPLITAQEKYRDPETRNTTATLVMTQNELIAVPAQDRRIAALALNPVHRRDEAYWTKFNELCGTHQGKEYIAAWLYGIEECKDFKTGIPVVMGNLRIRMAENRTDNNPLARILVPLFGTVLPVTKSKLTWRCAVEAGKVLVLPQWVDEVVEEEGDNVPFAADVSLVRLVNDWNSKREPTHNYSQTLAAGMALPREELFKACKEASSSAINLHNMPNFVQDLFGQQGRDLLCPTNTPNKFKYVTIPRWGSLYEGGAQVDLNWYEPLVERFCTEIYDSLDKENGVPKVKEGVWPIDYARLLTFINYGVSVERRPQLNIYEITYAYGLGPIPLHQAHYCWPTLPVLRKMYFKTSGGERTPVDRIPKYPLESKDWYKQGFGFLRPVESPAEAARDDLPPYAPEPGNEEHGDFLQWYRQLREMRAADEEDQRALREHRLYRANLRAQEERQRRIREEREALGLDDGISPSCPS